MATSTQRHIAEYGLLADALLKLHPSGGLLKKENKSYVVLERKLTKSDQNKNAVSIIREGVSFMVPDVEAELAAVPSNLHAVRSKDFPRILFPTLTLQEVESNTDYFAQLIRKAKHESEELQQSIVGAGH